MAWLSRAGVGREIYLQLPVHNVSFFLSKFHGFWVRGVHVILPPQDENSMWYFALVLTTRMHEHQGDDSR